MTRDILSQALDRLDPAYLSEALTPVRPRRLLRRTACALLAAALLLGTAWAVSPELRQAVVSILFPRYTAGMVREIEAGHHSGSFDPQDTLLTFLDHFDREELEPGLTLRQADGFDYTLTEEDEDSISALVDCGDPNLRLLVRLERLDYGETSGLWQVVSYQIIPAKNVS